MRIISAFGAQNQVCSFRFADRNFTVFSHIPPLSQANSWPVSLLPSGSEVRKSVTDDNNSLTAVLNNLTTTLSQLSKAS